jgi:hypothetical protein
MIDIKAIARRLTFLPEPNPKRAYPIGTILKARDGDFYLVGDVNTGLGTCDDCPLRPDEIVAVADLSELPRTAT